MARDRIERDSEPVCDFGIDVATRKQPQHLDLARSQQRVLTAADSVMTRIAQRQGTFGLLVADSTLYVETTLTMIQLRQLLSDIQANPRKYFTFSVF